MTDPMNPMEWIDDYRRREYTQPVLHGPVLPDGSFGSFVVIYKSRDIPHAIVMRQDNIHIRNVAQQPPAETFVRQAIASIEQPLPVAQPERPPPPATASAMGTAGSGASTSHGNPSQPATGSGPTRQPPNSHGNARRGRGKPAEPVQPRRIQSD